jgi:hypothetical protein
MDVDLLDLKVDYFEPVSREVFDEYMRNRGFAPGEADDTGSLIYRRDDCFLRVHYYVEDRPRYSPMVSIGVLPATSLGIPFERIGLWYAVPTGSDAKDYELWRFSDAVELKQVLTRIRDEVVEVYGRPLWENPDQLARLINRRYEEAVAEREDEALKRKRRRRNRLSGRTTIAGRPRSTVKCRNPTCLRPSESATSYQGSIHLETRR